ncbi:Lysine-specific demethylase 2B [Apiospora arundinis]|uniref:Lysine-specific demethylase 2B n=1 Tax=Apiospora arundinis TaxID=335852 RepID=A0ABR2HSX1_9PEZI
MEPREVEGPPLLDADKTNQFQTFLQSFRGCRDETERYSLCLRKRDQLLGAKDLLEIEFSIYDQIFTESSTYIADKNSDEKWQNFTQTANEGSKNRDRLQKELQSAVEHWGNDLVQHLAVGPRGISFAIKFASVARQHRDWEKEALPRLQQLVLRRIQISAFRRSYPFSIEPIDLDNAKAWKTQGSFVKTKDPHNVELPFRKVSAKELPDGYTFGPYGLIVPEDAAVNEPSDFRHSIHFLYTPDSRPSGETTQTTKTGDAGSASNTLGSTTDHMTNTDCSSIGSGTGPDTREGTAETTPTTESDGEISDDERDGQVPSRGRTTGALAAGCTPDIFTPRKSLRGRAGHSQPQAQETKSPLFSTETKRSSRPRRKERALVTKHEVDTARLSALANRLSALAGSSSSALLGTSVVPLKRRRATSPSPAFLQLDVPMGHPAAVGAVSSGYDPGARPVCNWPLDEAYRTQAIAELREEAGKKLSTRGSQTARCLLPILQDCKHPTTDDKPATSDKAAIPELYLLDGHQAKMLLDKITPDIPIITERQQPFQWDNPARPIPEFFDWMEDHDRMVSVQIPSLHTNESSCEPRSMRQVYERFLSSETPVDPWNVLDCSCPLPSTLPDFLTGRNCQLLAQIRRAVLDKNGNSAGRTVATREEWAEWRDIESWALLSEGGHCTAAHMDSHGLATWITIQEGHFGFAWMSRPTTEQRQDWMDDTEYYDREQKWRYWVLKPGQTVFFPSGTIHSVFRIRQTQTLGLGGHILQWSGLEQWIDVVRKQAEAPNSTNEDMTDACKWFPVIEDLVRKRLKRGDAPG